MKLFEIYTNSIKNKFLCCPLNHPNIEYDWTERKIESNDIIFIGKIKKDDEIQLFKLYDVSIGFFDEECNLVTPVLLHSNNLSMKIYQDICNELNKIFLKGCNKKLPSEILSLIKELDKDGLVYESFNKYIFTGKFELPADINFKKENFDLLIDLIKEDNLLLDEYSHLTVFSAMLKR